MYVVEDLRGLGAVTGPVWTPGLVIAGLAVAFVFYSSRPHHRPSDLRARQRTARRAITGAIRGARNSGEFYGLAGPPRRRRRRKSARR